MRKELKIVLVAGAKHVLRVAFADDRSLRAGSTINFHPGTDRDVSGDVQAQGASNID